MSSVPLESLAETYDDPYLCNSCEKELISIRNLEKKVGELKAGIVGRLSKLHPVFSIFRVEPQKSIAETRKTIAETWKRTLEESSEAQPAQKELHLWLLVENLCFIPMNHILKLIKRHQY